MLRSLSLLLGVGTCQLSKIEIKRLKELALGELDDSKYLNNMVYAGVILEQLALIDEPTMQSVCRTYSTNIAVHLSEQDMSTRDVYF